MRLGLLYPTSSPLASENWSGTPNGLAHGFSRLGVDVVPIADGLPLVARKSVGALSYLGGRRGAVAYRAPVRQQARTWSLRRALRRAGPLDALLAMGTELYDLAAIVPDGLSVATYDDCTLEQMWRYPYADIRQWGFPEEEVLKWFHRQRRSSRVATGCCVSTSFAADSFVKDYGVEAARVHVVGMGHRPRNRTATEERDWSAPRFLFVGVDWKRKNGEAVLRAFASLRQKVPNATLDVVGEHAHLEIEGVNGHGFLARDDPKGQRLLDELFARATAFVLPSRFDPSPIAYLEAASAGLPVIATSEGGAKELLGSAAITVHPDDDGALLAAMLRLTDPAQASPMGDEAARRAAESSWIHVAGKIIDALGGRPAPASSAAGCLR